MSDDASLLSLAINLAQRAAAEIQSIRARGFQVQLKVDRSVVTDADHASEALILAGLRQALPDCNVVAEEESAAGVIAPSRGEFWLIDPLDGTVEFSGGGNDFAVNIGLVRAGKPVLGVVALPASGSIYSGIVGVGAWFGQGSGNRIAISARLPPPEGLTVVTSRHHGDEARLGAFLANRTVASVVRFGSSLKFCSVAEGNADVYPRFGRTMEWDTCAPQAVVEAAGGTVETLAGCSLGYGKPGWDNPDFVCWGRRVRG